MQIKSSEINIFSPLNEECELPNQDIVDAILKDFEDKRERGNGFFEADGSLRRIDEPTSEEGKNIEKAMDYIREHVEDDGRIHDYEVKKYSTYSVDRIRKNRKMEKLIMDLAGLFPYFNYLTYYVENDTYGDDNIWEVMLNTAEIYAGDKADGRAINIIEFAKDKNNSEENSVLPRGDVYAVDFLPYAGSGTNYSDVTRYYIKPGDIEIEIRNNVDNYNAGCYVIYLSKGSMDGDPNEPTILWYYKN